MTVRTKANFSGTYLTTGGTWPDNGTGDITPADLGAGIQDILDSTAIGWSPNYDVNPPNGVKFGAVDAGNYSEFQEDTGFHFAYGSGTGWDDLRFPASAINPPGSMSDADRDTSDTTKIGTLLFAANSTELVAGIAQMPHGWVEGSTIRPHIHWSPTNGNAGNVVWQLDYDLADVNGIFTGSYTTVQITGVVGGDADGHQVNNFPEIDMNGYGLSTIMLWRVSRIGGDTADTYGADARLYEFDIHYRTDAFGSRQEYTK